MQLLHCENLSFSYDGKVAVKDVTFSISSGEYICIVGENGSGKSTLVKGLLQLHPPSGGTLRLGDCLKGGIGYLPQQKTSWKHFPASVLEVTLSGCLNRMKLRPFYGKKEKQQAMENLERMGIAHLHRHCFRELSGGQQQRVLLARALCAAKHLLILDEPIASLDPIAAKEFYEQIQRLHTELHMAVLMVSHDMKNALSYGEKILHLDTKQLFFGTPDAYLATGAGQRFGERGQQISCT